jgi:predicted nucleic acid-binding protein
MKLFIDANVLVAVLNMEQPLFSHAARILSLSDNPRFVLYTSSLCLAITYYFSQKKSGRKLANKKIRSLASHLKLIAIDNKALQQVIVNEAINDFEDGLQYYAAENVGVECIITENVEDYYFGSIKVLTCEAFFNQFLLKHRA